MNITELNQYSSLITAASTLALVAVTLVLAFYTKRLGERTSEPFVVFYLRSSESSAIALNQVIFNSGTGTAFDIVAKMSPALPAPNEQGDALPEIRKVSLLPPGQTLSFAGTMGPKIHDKTFQVEVSWSRKPGSRKRSTLRYSVTPHDGFAGGFGVKTVHHLTEEAKKIRSILERVHK